MTEPGASPVAAETWRGVDEGWGRRAADFAALTEPTNCREYVAMHHHLGVGAGDRLLDLACGAGLAVELGQLRGATCAGIDASERLVAVARDRSPDADLRVGDMNALPWADETFDVVTSFRGIWGTTPRAVAEAYRVLVPGGRIGLTVWGHIKASAGAWALSPFSLAAAPKVENQSAMVALGRPGAGETLLAASGFTDVERLDIPFIFEFADPETYARAFAATGPAFEAIETVGEDAFRQAAVEEARQRVREGLPLRAPIAVVGYVGIKPRARPAVAKSERAAGTGPQSAAGYLSPPPHSPHAQRLFDDDLASVGYVMNVSRLWAYLPAALDGLSDLMGQVTAAASLSHRQRAILVTAAASTIGDSYCALAWGKRLAAASTPATAAGVIAGSDGDLEDDERALAAWARKVASDPNGIAPADVQALRDAGFDDAQIFGITTFVALRLAFSTVNDALGARPDYELGASMPEAVRLAVSFGRAIASDGGAGVATPPSAR